MEAMNEITIGWERGDKFAEVDLPNNHRLNNRLKKLHEAEEYEADPNRFFGAGGAWYEGILRDNRCFTVRRHTEKLSLVVPYMELCRRFDDDLKKLESGETTWKDMMPSKPIMTIRRKKNRTSLPVKSSRWSMRRTSRGSLKRMKPR